MKLHANDTLERLNVMLSQITFCYVVVDGRAPHSDWAFLSASLLRRHYPNCKVAVSTDKQTAANLGARDHPLLTLADKVICADGLDGTARYRSRFIKTRLRLDVEGPIIFLDTDTLPVAPIDNMVSDEVDFAAVRDHTDIKAIADWYFPACRELGWGYSDEVYLSSGMFFLADTEAGHTIGRTWHERWKRWSDFDKSKLHSDQPSLNATLADANARVRELPREYDAIVFASMRTVPGAKIFHYPASYGRMPRSTLLHYLQSRFAKTGMIEWSAVERAADTSNPWVYPMPIVHAEMLCLNSLRFVRVRARQYLPQRFRPFLIR